MTDPSHEEYKLRLRLERERMKLLRDLLRLEERERQRENSLLNRIGTFLDELF